MGIAIAIGLSLRRVCMMDDINGREQPTATAISISEKGDE